MAARHPIRTLGIVAVGVAGLSVLVWLVLRPGSPTEPTASTTASGRLAYVELPSSVWKVVTPPTSRGLAADDYNKGVVEFLDSDGFAELRKMSDEQKLRIRHGRFPYRPHKFINAGAKKRRMQYFTQYVSPQAAVAPRHEDLVDSLADPNGPLPHLAAFRAMARASLLYGRICERAGERSEAKRIYGTVLVFGHHVAQDRVRLCGVLLGLQIMREAAGALEAFHQGDDSSAEASAARHVVEDVRSLESVLAKKAEEALFGEGPHGPPHAGDLRNLAANDADPMWRIEAIRRLGILRVALKDRPEHPDAMAVRRLLESLAKEPPDDGSEYGLLIRAAAEYALGFPVD